MENIRKLTFVFIGMGMQSLIIAVLLRAGSIQVTETQQAVTSGLMFYAACFAYALSRKENEEEEE